MTGLPQVDVNLFVYNGAATLPAAIESVLGQSWPALTLTIIDNFSDDGTGELIDWYAAQSDRIRVHRNHANMGPVINCQRAFWHGEAAYVMPKTADDLLAPDFVERVMQVLIANPGTAMCHAAGLVFTGDGTASQLYPAEHCLSATGDDPVARACQVMAAYTSAPSFWGIYRRAAVDRLARIAYRAGWDHALLAELALYGEIRHVPAPLFWRRDGGKPVRHLAVGCSEFSQRGLPVDDALAEQRWRTPLITTAYNHVEMFAVARLPHAARLQAMEQAVAIFRARWLPLMRQEAAAFRAILPDLHAELSAQTGLAADWMARQITEAMCAIQTMLPEEIFPQPQARQHIQES